MVEAKVDGNGAGTAAPEAPKKSNFIMQVAPAVRQELAEDLKAFEGKDITEFVQEHVKLARTVRDRGIIVPTKDSPEEEIEAFHARMGLPRKAEDYKFTFDEKVLPKEAVDAARAFVHANGYTAKQAQAYVSSLESIARSAQEAGARRRTEGEKNLMASLVREYGGDQKAAEGAYNLAVKRLAGYSEATRQKLYDSGLAFDPAFLKDSAAIQETIEPHRLVEGDPGKGGGAPAKEKSLGKQGSYSDDWKKYAGQRQGA